MKPETITSIENELKPDGLTGYVFHLITGGDYDNLCDTAVLEEGACMVLKGTAPLRERREMFLKVYDGCRKVADRIKQDVGWEKQDGE